MTIDRDDMLAKVRDVCSLTTTESEITELVDTVILPALTTYLEEPYRAQVATIVDTTVAKWMAANLRQRDMITRLQNLNRDLRLTVRHLEEAVVDPGD